MIIKINQTKSPMARFDIIIDDQLCYTGSAFYSAMLLNNTLSDLNGNTVLSSRFQPFEDLKNAIPFKWAWSEKQIANHVVLDGAETPVGLFYVGSHGLAGEFSSQYIVKYGEYELFIYPISKGRMQYAPIFLSDRQIGQMNKDNFVEDNKDWYRLYLLDEFEDLAPVLSLFVIYFDCWNYLHAGEYRKGTSQVTYRNRYSKFQKLYDPNWLPTHFTAVDDSQMLAEMSKRRRRNVKLALGTILGIGVLSAAIIGIMWLTAFC